MGAGPVLVFLLIVVISLVIGAVSQVLKNAQQLPPPARPRPRPGPVARPASGDIDRFLEEIDRLRKRKADGDTDRSAEPPPVAKPVARPVKPPVAKPVPVARSRRRPEPPTVVAKPKPTPPRRLADLPVAPPLEALPAGPAPYQRSEVTAPPRLAALPQVTGGPTVTASPGRGRQTPFARDLATLLASPKSVPMAVVLTEILGPPKCRKG